MLHLDRRYSFRIRLAFANQLVQTQRFLSHQVTTSLWQVGSWEKIGEWPSKPYDAFASWVDNSRFVFGSNLIAHRRQSILSYVNTIAMVDINSNTVQTRKVPFVFVRLVVTQGSVFSHCS